MHKEWICKLASPKSLYSIFNSSIQIKEAGLDKMLNREFVQFKNVCLKFRQTKYVPVSDKVACIVKVNKMVSLLATC